ncbi:hypothetical protein SAMN05880570_0847 [Paenibacillus sp. RU4T]|nr:hypothetical protein SAMN05880555_0848 [Paenibacillus sp. RU4X]SIQ37450.1 hypothetical protein SAMN05880570_0847 [Paenibacillus sp. RU4T]
MKLRSFFGYGTRPSSSAIHAGLIWPAKARPPLTEKKREAGLGRLRGSFVRDEGDYRKGSSVRPASAASGNTAREKRRRG